MKGKLARKSASRGFKPLVALIVIVIAIPIAAADAKPRTKVSADFFGISAQHPDPGDFQGMGAAGFGTFRASINWRAVQSSRDGAYDWTQPDQEIRSATESGLRPVPVVFGTPSFVHPPVSQNLYPPTSKEDLAEWQDFTRALAARYGPGGDFFDANPDVEQLPIKTWIIWNEQNVEFNWRPKPSPVQYAKLIKQADLGISAVDPKAKLVLGGMFGYPGGDLSMKAPRYLRQFYRVKGVKRHFEAVNVHPYGHGGLPDVKNQIGDLRSVMKAAGDRNAQIYIGEIGWASTGPPRSGLVVGAKGHARSL